MMAAERLEVEMNPLDKLEYLLADLLDAKALGQGINEEIENRGARINIIEPISHILSELLSDNVEKIKLICEEFYKTLHGGE